VNAGGFTDWYLPAQAELQLCFANCRAHFEPECYLVASQSSAHYAWLQDFSYGTTDYVPKNDDYRARAVRRFLVI